MKGKKFKPANCNNVCFNKGATGDAGLQCIQTCRANNAKKAVLAKQTCSKSCAKSIQTKINGIPGQCKSECSKTKVTCNKKCHSKFKNCKDAKCKHSLFNCMIGCSKNEIYYSDLLVKACQITLTGIPKDIKCKTDVTAKEGAKGVECTTKVTCHIKSKKKTISYIAGSNNSIVKYPFKKKLAKKKVSKVKLAKKKVLVAPVSRPVSASASTVITANDAPQPVPSVVAGSTNTESISSYDKNSYVSVAPAQSDQVDSSVVSTAPAAQVTTDDKSDFSEGISSPVNNVISATGDAPIVITEDTSEQQLENREEADFGLSKGF